jgi:preflagellin peptidase FlaK
VLSILISLAAFIVASISDLKKREVSDGLWLIYGPTGAVLTLLRFAINPSLVRFGLLSIGLTAMLAFSLCRLGFFGGADAKAFICLAVSLPLPPTTMGPVTGYVHPFFPITVMITSFLCSAAIIPWIAMKNLKTYLTKDSSMFDGLNEEHWWRKIAVFVIGFPIARRDLRKRRFLYPLEEVSRSTGRPHRTLRLFNAQLDHDLLVSEYLNSFAEADSDAKVWVTPGLPMLLFTLLGLVVSICLGDVIFIQVFK